MSIGAIALYKVVMLRLFLENLSEALLDFTSLVDLLAWLEAQG